MSKYHSGGSASVDIFAPVGSSVFAVVSGKARAEHWPVGGNTVTITGEDNKEYYYAHLKTKGNAGTVKAGDIIGQVGRSGSAKGKCSHLHIAISSKGERVDDFGDGSTKTFDELQQISNANVLVNNNGKSLTNSVSVEALTILLAAAALSFSFITNTVQIQAYEILLSIPLLVLGLALFAWSRHELYASGQDYKIDSARIIMLKSGPYKFISKPICLSVILVMASFLPITGDASVRIIIPSIMAAYVAATLFISKGRQY